MSAPLENKTWAELTATQRMDQILRVAAAAHCVLEDQIMGDSRRRAVCDARFAFYRHCLLQNFTQSETGRYLGGRDHGSVLNGNRRMTEYLETMPATHEVCQREAVIAQRIDDMKNGVESIPVKPATAAECQLDTDLRDTVADLQRAARQLQKLFKTLQTAAEALDRPLAELNPKNRKTKTT